MLTVIQVFDLRIRSLLQVKGMLFSDRRLNESSAPTPTPAAPGQSALRYSEASSSFEASFVPNLTGRTSIFNSPILWGGTSLGAAHSE